MKKKIFTKKSIIYYVLIIIVIIIGFRVGYLHYFGDGHGYYVLYGTTRETRFGTQYSNTLRIGDTKEYKDIGFYFFEFSSHEKIYEDGIALSRQDIITRIDKEVPYPYTNKAIEEARKYKFDKIMPGNIIISIIIIILLLVFPLILSLIKDSSKVRANRKKDRTNRKKLKKIKEIEEMKQNNIISAEEYEAKKKEILGDS